MTRQEEILRGCNHEHRTSEVRLTDGATIFCCCNCWNDSVAARRAAQKAANEERKKAGIAFWEARGIKVGQKVYRMAASMFGTYRVEGVAKVNRNGAYVSSSAQPGALAPEGWVAN